MADNDLKENGQFYIRVRQGNWEIEVSAPKEEFVLEESKRLIEDFLSKGNEVHQQDENVTESSVNGSNGHHQQRALKPESLGEFFGQFKFQTNLDKILILAYWSEVRQGQPSFTSEEILAKFKDVKEQQPGYIERDMKSLVKKKFLLENGKSDNKVAYSLTNTGIREVETRLSQAKV